MSSRKNFSLRARLNKRQQGLWSHTDLDSNLGSVTSWICKLHLSFPISKLGIPNWQDWENGNKRLKEKLLNLINVNLASSSWLLCGILFLEICPTQWSELYALGLQRIVFSLLSVSPVSFPLIHPPYHRVSQLRYPLLPDPRPSFDHSGPSLCGDKSISPTGLCAPWR